MAIELPRASPASVSTSRRPRIAKLPTAGDVPTQDVARDPGLQVPELGAVGRGLEDVGASFTEVVDRIATRQEALDRMRIRAEVREKLRNTLEAADSTSDLSAEGVLDSLGAEARGILEAAAQGHQGRPGSQSRLSEILEADLSEFSDRAANRAVAAGDERTDQVAGEIINGLSARALQGENINDLIDEGMEHIAPGAELAGALRPGGEIAYARLLNRRVMTAAIERLFTAGAIDDVQNMMENPAVQRSLGEEGQREIFRRLETAKRDRTALRTQPIKDIPRDIFDRMTPEQQARVLGAAPSPTTIKGVPAKIFAELTGEEQRRLLGVSAPPKAGVSGIPRDIFDALTPEQQERVLGAEPDATTIKGIPGDIFNKLSPEEQKRVLEAEPETIVVKPGDIVLRDGEEIARGEKKPEKLVEIFDVDSPTKSRFVPESEAIGQPGRERQPVISITNQGESAMAAELGKRDAERVTKLEDDAQIAFRTKAEVARMQAATESGRFTTGVFSDFRLFLSRFASFVGATDETMELLGDAATADTLDAASNRLGVEAAQKLGRITNMSLQFVRDSLPNLTRTPEGNIILMEVMDRTADRQIQLASLAEDFLQRYGTLRPKENRTFFQAVRDLEENDPVITDELRQRIIKGSSAETPTFVERFKGLTKDVPRFETPGELDEAELPSGTEFFWVPDGKTYTKD